MLDALKNYQYIKRSFRNNYCQDAEQSCSTLMLKRAAEVLKSGAHRWEKVSSASSWSKAFG